jgi:hypothetical protein
MKQIQNKILKTELVNWQELKDLQPTNLKNPYHNEKTKQSLIKNGFSLAFSVWESKNGIYILDGHLRTDLLRELVSDGFKVPNQLTCSFLDLKNRKEAVKYLLEVFNTKKNPIREEALIDWFEVEGVEVESVEVASLDMEAIVTETPGEDQTGESDGEFNQKLGEVLYEPKDTNHKTEDLYEWNQNKIKLQNQIEQIKDLKLRELLKARLSYFCIFNYSKIADYYAYQADKDTKILFEKLGLVLLDKDQLVANGFADLLNKVTNNQDDPAY